MARPRSNERSFALARAEKRTRARRLDRRQWAPAQATPCSRYCAAVFRAGRRMSTAWRSAFRPKRSYDRAAGISQSAVGAASLPSQARPRAAPALRPVTRPSHRRADAGGEAGGRRTGSRCSAVPRGPTGLAAGAASPSPAGRGPLPPGAAGLIARAPRRPAAVAAVMVLRRQRPWRRRGKGKPHGLVVPPRSGRGPCRWAVRSARFRGWPCYFCYSRYSAPRRGRGNGGTDGRPLPELRAPGCAE